MSKVNVSLIFENIEDVNPDRLNELALKLADECPEKSESLGIQLRGVCYSQLDMFNKTLGFYRRNVGPRASLQAFNIRNDEAQTIESDGAECLFLLALVLLMDRKWAVYVRGFDAQLPQAFLDDALSLARRIDLSCAFAPSWFTTSMPDIADPSPNDSVFDALTMQVAVPAAMDFRR